MAFGSNIMNRPETPPTVADLPVDLRRPEVSAPASPSPKALESSEPNVISQPEQTQPEPIAASTPPEADGLAHIKPLSDRSPVRLILTAGTGFLILFLFLRTFAIEPFGVPTGSMAPALIGNHVKGLVHGAVIRCEWVSHPREEIPRSSSNILRVRTAVSDSHLRRPGI